MLRPDQAHCYPVVKQPWGHVVGAGAGDARPDRNDIGEPEFSSIEEWLGVNTDEYYAALD
jgi:hypothetical protein